MLFILLWLFSSRPRPLMAVSGLFLVGIRIVSIWDQFLRMPDAHIGYLAFGWLNHGAAAHASHAGGRIYIVGLGLSQPGR